MSKPRGVDAVDADLFVFISGAAAGAHRAHDLALRLLDEHRARLGQELAAAGLGQGAEEVGVAGGALGQGTAG